MDKPPEWLSKLLPEGVNSFLDNGGWYGVLGVLGLIVVLVLWKIGRALFGRQERRPESLDLTENFDEYPQLPPSTGDRRLLAEGVPVRLRLVVLAPSGKDAKIDPDAVYPILERVLPGFGAIAKHDKPRVRVWPKQLSYEGFANLFHRNTPTPEGENNPSAWVMIAGRTPLPGIMVGVAVQALRETTIGRKTLKAHDWPSVLRVRVRD